MRALLIATECSSEQFFDATSSSNKHRLATMDAFGIRAIVPRPEGRGLPRIQINSCVELSTDPCAHKRRYSRHPAALVLGISNRYLWHVIKGRPVSAPA
jgi:hypothetical protein